MPKLTALAVTRSTKPGYPLMAVGSISRPVRAGTKRGFSDTGDSGHEAPVETTAYISSRPLTASEIFQLSTPRPDVGIYFLFLGGVASVCRTKCKGPHAS